MKSIMKGRCAVVMLSVAIAMTALDCAQSRPEGGVRPLGLQVQLDDPCRILCSMMIVWSDDSRPRSQFNVAGNAVAKDISFSDAKDPIASATEKIISLTATGNSREFGTVTTTLDTSRAASPTIITANQKNADFPATGQINFNVNIRLASQPGAVYRNREEIRIEDRNLKNFRPHVGASYRLLKPVEFVDISKPEATAFTMNELSVAIN